MNVENEFMAFEFRVFIDLFSKSERISFQTLIASADL